MKSHSRSLTVLFLASCLIQALSAVSHGQNPDNTEAIDEARERKVMERFLGVLEKTPRRGTALDRVYGYHVERGSLEAFQKTYQQRVAQNPSDGSSWLLIGLIEAQRGRDAAAVEAFRKAETQRSDDALPSYYLGQALVLVGQPEAAAEAFERALTRKPSRADLLDVYQALGRVHQRAHRNDKALAVWDRLEKSFPEDPRVQDQIAHALAEEGQDAAALIRFEALAKSTKDRFRQVQFAIEAAELKVRLNKGSEALADFESLLAKLDPESWLYREVRRKVEDVFLRTDDLAGLASYYERWIKKTPDDVEAMARLGRTLAGQGRLPEARKWFEEAVRLAPSRRELRLALIEQLVLDRKFAEAASQYEALAKLEPNNPDVVRDWGRLLLRDTAKPEAERKQAAAAVWRRLAPDDAKDAVVIAQAADLFRQAGLSDAAIKLYQRAIKLAPDSGQYREYLGEYYHALKRPADALATWRAGIEGPSRNARSLGRLGEVLAGFGYRNEAVEPLTEACRLEPDDFDLRLKLADLKLALEKPLEALVELEKAEKAASADEQTEAVLDRLIRTYQASNTLTTTIDSLRKSLTSRPSAAGWTRLARLLEADQKANDAAQAITEATKLDPKSIPAWVATARLREAAGDLLGAAEALRILTKLDRRSRTDYLTGIAKLEARLGRRGPALEAGRELLAAAPGNPDHHQFFAELCFQLGEPDEGLDALRRASRANPSDPKAMLTLAENLARQFRAEEAIELYWRAFAKTVDVEAKLSIVVRMTDQYLQRNQLDRLLARLERELREPNQQRELALSLAQVHSSSGDYSTARIELERLLTSSPRDTQLLLQLSNLAEQEGDIGTAAKYQKQALDVAPNPEGNGRLAQLYLDSGEITEAEAVWSKLANDTEDPTRILSALDRLISHGKSETALAITERMLVKQPGDWEALYREGVALEALGKPAEAARRFRSILDLKLDDAVSLLAKTKSKNMGPNSGKTRISTNSAFPIETRIQAAQWVRRATKLDEQQYNYNNGNAQTLWSPSEFGEARMAALAWLFEFARRENREDTLVDTYREARDKAGSDPRPRWDWYYLQLVRNEGPETFEAARDLVKALPGDPAADYAYLSSLSARLAANPKHRRRMPDEESVDKMPPLASDDLELVLAGYRNLRKKKPEIEPTRLMSLVSTELKRARRDAEVEKIYRDAVASASDMSSTDAAITFAAEKGNIDDFLALQERADRLVAKQPVGLFSGSQENRADGFAEAMNRRADSKAYGDVLRVLDYFLDSIRKPAAFEARAKARSSSTLSAQSNYSVRVGKNRRDVALDYPLPNAYYDSEAIQVLRNAFELYKRDDVLSDLTAHFKGQSERLPEAERIYPLLAMGYLAWWNEDKDEAIEIFNRAVEMAKGDVELRLGLAEIQARRGEAAEALGMVESVEPLDQKTMQRREVMALRLAVLSGDVERARKASERLFGLRLDNATQIQLASQMNQLGMHELAETVLSRVRRKSGGSLSTLVALMLQYQQSEKTDQAFQVAGQILRSTANRQAVSLNNPNMNNNEDVMARSEAIAVFARSGKLKELIERAEAQLASAPGSVAALQVLGEYYRADNQEEKVKETYARLAKVRPEDARLRYQIASQMLQSGDIAGSIEHFTASFKKEPSFYLNQRYHEIQNAFFQSGKMAELGKLFEDLDLKLFSSNPWAIQPIIATLNQDEKTREMGMKLFRKFWKTFPDTRSNLILMLDTEALSRSSEIYDYLREAVVPPAGKTKITPWAFVDQVQGWDNQGNAVGAVNRLLDVATRQNRLEELLKDVDETTRRLPEWSGGRALKAIILVRRGKVPEARRALEELLAGEKEIPSTTRMIIGQELDQVKSLLDLELRLYEGAIDDESGPMNFQQGQGPAGRVVTLLHRAGKDAEARETVLKYSRKRPESSSGNASYDSYMQMVSKMAYAQQMIEVGYPADAIRFYEEILADTEMLDSIRQMYGSEDQIVQQIRQGLEGTLQGLNEKNLGPTLIALVPATISKPDDLNAKGKPATPPVDLVLTIVQGELDKSSVSSLYAETLKKAAKLKKPDIFNELKAVLARRIEADPKDLSGAIARCLVAIAEADQGTLAQTSYRLVEVINLMPLDSLDADARPNARQRTDATAQLGVWLVARECLKHDALRPTGLILQTRAFEAGRRQLDTRWSLVMLREAGQVAFDRGDRKGAEELWRKMLGQILAPPTTTKGKKPKVTILPQIAAMLMIAQVVAPPAPIPFYSRNDAATTTFARSEQAMQVAMMASDHSMHELSADAVRNSLGGGPPVVPIELDPNQNNQPLGQPNGSGGDEVAAQIEQRIQTLNVSWTQHQMPAQLAYETLRTVVLPDSRPGEVFLYLRPLGQGKIDKPRSVGELLARRAVEANQADDLRRRIEARRDQPLAAISARVLEIQLALAMKDEATTTRLLRSLADRLKQSPMQGIAEPICHAAIPALDMPTAEPVALPLIEAAVKTFAAGGGEGQEVIGPILISAARRKFKAQKAGDARVLLKSYLDKMQSDVMRSNPEYFLYWRKQVLANAAGEFARGGQPVDAWDLLGKYADAPTSKQYGSDTEMGISLAFALKSVEAMPAAERYEMLRAWSMPTKERKSIRLITAFVPEDPAIPAKFGSMPHLALGGLAATSSLLIDAARAAGTLDALLLEAKKAAEEKLENGKTLLILTQIAGGHGAEAREAILARVDELKKAAKVPVVAQNLPFQQQAATIDWSDFLIAHAALDSRLIDGPSEDLAKLLIAEGQSPQSGTNLPRLRRDLALHRAGRAGKLANPPGPDPGLAYWHPSSLQASMTHRLGSIVPFWVESQGIVSQIAGPQSQYLLFDYPITGKFEVSADVFLGDGAEGQLSYGGLIFEPHSGGSVYPVGHFETRQASDHFANRNRYNRMKIQVEPGKLRVLLNGHLFYQEALDGSTSPWLAFFSDAERQTAFRNVSISGSPEIPREVRLVQGDHLEGWACGFYNESQPPRRVVGQTGMSLDLDQLNGGAIDYSQFDWHAKDGVILGRRADELTPGQVLPSSRIYYHRPILDGESISYEFLYEPGRTMVHPSIERLVFLLEPEGVKLHWLTDGEDNGTGLEVDNSVEAPEFRRGAGPLPLKPGEWNKTSIRYEGGLIVMDLNGTKIWEYLLEPANQRILGFYHDKSKTEAKIRDIILRGNWPTTVPTDLIARRDPNAGFEDRRARGAMIDARFITEAAGSILAEARILPPDQRYNKLVAYVLPGPDHSDFRLQGEMTIRPSVDPKASLIDAPAIELLTTAKNLGRLQDLAHRLENVKPSKGADERGRLAMQVLIFIALDREAEADQTLRALKIEVEKHNEDDPGSSRWDELIAASAGIDRAGLRASSLELFELMDQQWRKGSLTDWAAILRPIRARALSSMASTKVAGWVTVTHSDAASRGRGLPMPTWTYDSGVWTHHPGHKLDYLYLTSPIRGNFTVECELTSFDWRETQLSYASTVVALGADRKSYQLRQFGQVDSTSSIDPPFLEIGPWYSFKLAVVDGTYTAFVEGRKIHESRMADEPDPWLALTSQGIANGGVRNLKITGKPVIPDSIILSAGSTLDGWLSDYYDDSFLWNKQGDEIVGLKVHDPNAAPGVVQAVNDARAIGVAGSKQESVLKYNRPMLEDGEITYEFYHQPGQVMVHPALDRLTFLIESDGVKIHWMTDAQFDRTGMSPDNTTTESDRRRGPASPPLQPDSWNRVRLRLTGDVVTLTLNDIVIYERPLEPGNQRDFGLFRFADETECRVRNVQYQGQWPRSITR